MAPLATLTTTALGVALIMSAGQTRSRLQAIVMIVLGLALILSPK
jgi:predicted cobalt transporter CbtA